VNRVIRDIPSTNVVAGNKRTSLRMDVFEELARRGQRCNCIRCREVRGEKVDLSTLQLVDTVYPAGLPGRHGSYGNRTEEHFIQFVTPASSEHPTGNIAGYLRLSLPGADAPDVTGILPDLKEAAIIREVHVYGQSLSVGEERAGAAQHIGLGTRLLDEATRIANEKGFPKLAVIAAVGTRLYYENRGFERGAYYLVKKTM
jgi:elongator complex protein 3